MAPALFRAASQQELALPENKRTAKKPIVITPEQSREGEIGWDRFVRGPMRYVLAISTVLAIVALIVVFVAFR